MRNILAFAFFTLAAASKLPLNPTGTQIFIVQAPLADTRYQEQDSKGFYSFGYNGDTSAKAEYKTLDGSSRGFYSYIDAEGQLQTVRYEAGKDQGFRAAATNLPQAPIENRRAPAPVRDTPEVQQAKLEHFEAVREAEQRHEAEQRQDNENEEQNENERNSQLMEKAAEQMMQIIMANNANKNNDNNNENNNENNNNNIDNNSGSENIQESEAGNITADDINANSNEDANDDNGGGNENNGNESNNSENYDNIESDNSERQPCDISEAYAFPNSNSDASSSFPFDDFQTKALKDITSFRLKNSFDDINRLNLRTIYNLENEKSSSVLRLPDFSQLRRPSKSKKSKSQNQQKIQQQAQKLQAQPQSQKQQLQQQQQTEVQQPPQQNRRDEWVLPSLAAFEEIRIPSDGYFTVIAPSNQYTVQTPTIYTSLKRPQSSNSKLPISLSSTFSSQRINGKAKGRY